MGVIKSEQKWYVQCVFIRWPQFVVSRREYSISALNSDVSLSDPVTAVCKLIANCIPN
jgi:hypothetical protein